MDHAERFSGFFPPPGPASSQQPLIPQPNPLGSQQQLLVAVLALKGKEETKAQSGEFHRICFFHLLCS